MAQDEKKTVTNISIRAAYDSLAELMGERGRDIIMRNAGLERVITSPPEYTWDREFTNAEQLKLYSEIIELVGKVGAQGILRQIGYKNSETTILKFKILDSIKDLPSREKFIKSLEFISSAINRGKVTEDKNGMPAFDSFNCTACSGVTSTRPYCSQYAGAVQFLADWSFGKGKYMAKETKCMAMGDETCLFELFER